MSLQVKFPVGRLVDGSLYEPQTTDAEGKPLTIKTGAKAGQPTVKYFFAVAYAKTKAHWAQEDWGAGIWALGHQSWPQGQAQGPTFAWKILDGDSAVPNKKGRAPNSREGFPGCWVVNFSSTYAPKVCNSDGSAMLLDKDVVKLGHFVEVLGNVASNESVSQPGVYINHAMVAHSGYGKEIVIGINPATVGFGRGALPPGASQTPVGGLPTPPAPGAALPPPPAPPVATAAAAAPLPPPPVPTAVAPAPAFMAPPPPPAAPAAAVAARVMLGKAAGTQYQQWVAAGWTDVQLIANGLMAA